MFYFKSSSFLNSTKLAAFCFVDVSLASGSIVFSLMTLAGDKRTSQSRLQFTPLYRDMKDNGEVDNCMIFETREAKKILKTKKKNFKK